VAETSAPSRNRVVPAANEQVVLNQVAAATKITRVPKDVQPSLATAPTDFGWNYGNPQCQVGVSDSSEHNCTIGDPSGKQLLVLYGDSHAAMWIPAFVAIAVHDNWKLVVLAKGACPAAPVFTSDWSTWSDPDGTHSACEKWHQWAVRWINAHKPRLLVITQENFYRAPSVNGQPPATFSYAQWQSGLSDLFRSLNTPRKRVVLLGNTPSLPQPAPQCLAAHSKDVQTCSSPVHRALPALNQIDRSTARAAGVKYVDPTPWFCRTTCTAIIGNYVVYLDSVHITATWALYLENVLAQSLGLPPLPD